MTVVGTIYPLGSGGVLVDVGDEFPMWRPDAGAARRLLLKRDLLAASIDPDDPRPGVPAASDGGGPASGSPAARGSGATRT